MTSTTPAKPFASSQTDQIKIISYSISTHTNYLYLKHIEKFPQSFIPSTVIWLTHRIAGFLHTESCLMYFTWHESLHSIFLLGLTQKRTTCCSVYTLSYSQRWNIFDYYDMHYGQATRHSYRKGCLKRLLQDILNQRFE